MTLSDLLTLWRERDRRYASLAAASRPRFLTDREAESIRAFRDSELYLVPIEDRASGWQTVMRWQPPVSTR